MKISYNWLKHFIDLKDSPEELSLVLTDIGLEVESLEKVQTVPGGLEGLVVGEVKTCAQHPNADRLKVTTVDVGGEADLHIVCGAPNVAAGQKVIVATVGATLYPTTGDPFKIKKSKIRGEVSEGMICAEDEIGMGESHDGIMVLPAETPVGSSARTYFGINDDYLFEIGLTPNRADAASHLGVARDLAAFYGTELQWPEVVEPSAELSELYPVSVESPGSKRYVSCIIRDLKVGESPDWLKEKLHVIGVRPINNVVDITNYVLHGLGQPLHAFDAKKISGDRVVVRQAHQGESFTTLDGVERTLDAQDLVICDAEKPMCLAGVFGGAESGVTEETTEVFLESAYFDAVSVRKTSKRHGLKTDASFRFERGTDPDMPVIALQYAVQLLKELAGGELATSISDIYTEKVEPFRFEVRYDYVRRLIGDDISKDEIRRILLALDIQVSSENDDSLQVAVPPYRVDVTREVDVVEEVLRMYGYNRIPIGGQMKSSINPTPKPNKEAVLDVVADLLAANGYWEVMNNSLTDQEQATDPATAVRIVNPLSSDLDSMRQDLLPAMLGTVEYNQKRRAADLRLFEFGKTYRLVEQVYEESNHLAILLTGHHENNHWNLADQPSTFYHLKGMVDGVLHRLGLKDLQVEDAVLPYLNYGLAYVKNQKTLVSMGEVKGDVLKKADVQGRVFYAIFDWDLLLKLLKRNQIVFQEIPKFPAVKRDLALLLDENVSFEQLRQIAFRTERKFLKAVNVFDVYKGDKLPSGKKSYALNFIIQDEEKTMDDKRIDAIVKKLITNFEKETGATVRA